MIHTIYSKSFAKNKWHLVSFTLTALTALDEVSKLLKEEKDKGNFEFQADFQSFDNNFYVPIYLNELSKNKIAFN